MKTPEPKDAEGWTLSTLKALLDYQIESLEKIVDRERMLTDAKFVRFETMLSSQAEKVALALAASDKEAGKTEKDMEKRFDSVNEFRAQLADQARTFMPRLESEGVHQRMLERLQELTEWRNRTEGHGAGTKDNKTGIYAAIGGLAVVMSIVVIVANFLAS